MNCASSRQATRCSALLKAGWRKPRRKALLALEHVPREANVLRSPSGNTLRDIPDIAPETEHIGFAVGDRHHHDFHMAVLDTEMRMSMSNLPFSSACGSDRVPQDTRHPD